MMRRTAWLGLALAGLAAGQDAPVMDDRHRALAETVLRQMQDHRPVETPVVAAPAPPPVAPTLPDIARQALQAGATVSTPATSPPGPVVGPVEYAPRPLPAIPSPASPDTVPWLSLLFYYWCAVIALRLLYGLARPFGLYDPDVAGLLYAYLPFPWRPIYRRVLETMFRWMREFGHGDAATARWTPLFERMTLVYGRGGVLFGRLRVLGIGLLQCIGWRIERHCVLIGATAAGKTRWLISILALARGNVFVIDASAQMINAVGRRLGKGFAGILARNRDVHCLDPYSLARHFNTSSWNVFREMDRFVSEHGPEKLVGFLQKIASAMIKPEGNPANSWVSNDARAFAGGLLQFIRETEPRERQNLVRFRELATVGLAAPLEGDVGDRETKSDADSPKRRGRPKKKDTATDGFKRLLEAMKARGGAIASAAAVMESSQGSDGRNPPRSLLIEQTKWLDLPEMQRIVGGESDFDLHDMKAGRDGKAGRVCLFVCAPVSDIRDTLSGFFRLTTCLTMEIFRRLETVSLKQPLRLIADELPSLGHVEAIEDIGPEGRKHGLQLYAVAQDLEALARNYPNSWGGFLSGADATVFMSTNHKPTLQYLFERLGTATRKEKVDAGWLAGLFAKVMVRGQKVERPLMYMPQIEDFLHPDAQNVIVLRYGRPLKLKNAIYYLEIPVYAYEAPPLYPEAWGRRIGRALCRRLIPGPETTASSPNKEITEP